MSRPRPCPDNARVLLIGGGGREHALALAMHKSSRLEKLFITNPENAGLAKLGEPCTVAMDGRDPFHMPRWCERERIDLVVIGPEVPLAAGVADILQTPTRAVFGPSKQAAQLEADKVFAKQLMRHAAIPTGDARIFRDAETARAYIDAHEDPCVVKASGLAAGKGAIVCDTQEEALDAVHRIFVTREFGNAGNVLLIEDKLSGQEVSVQALVDGRNIWMLDPCQDHKQLNEGDTGPNTGGMGAYCPAPLLNEKTMAMIEREVIVPTIDALRRDGIEYRGVLYAGLMLTPAGPKVLEFNCRFGDPECQPLMARLKSDAIEMLWATATGGLEHIDINFDSRAACCVVMCSAGYPGTYTKGVEITGIKNAEALSSDGRDVIVYHAGTTRDIAGKLVTSGGRVLGVTAVADDLLAARDLANEACSKIHFDGAFYRRDIGDRILAKV